MLTNSLAILALSIACLLNSLSLKQPLYQTASKVALSRTVQIRVYVTEHNGYGGSGVSLGKGKVVTAYHVVSNEGRAIIAVKANGTKVGCTINRVDSQRDLALLQCDGFNLDTELALATPSDARVGTQVLLAGAPGRLPIILTQGIVSGEFPKWGKIILDATSGPGGSGGPVYTLRGKLIGVLQQGMQEPPWVVFTTSNLQLRRFLNGR